MIVQITALLTRTLRLETRAMRNHGLRLALGVMVLFTVMSVEQMSRYISAPGLHLLSSLMWWAAAAITLTGFSHFCSAITEEKEEQTIGLLRMAGLSPLAIMLGKSTARLWDVLLLVSTLLPFALLAVTLGGVSATQVMACAVGLMAYVFFLANLGLLASVVAKTMQNAVGLMVGAMIVIQLLPLMFSGLFRGNEFGLGDLCRLLIEATIWHRLSQVLTTGYAEGVFGFMVWFNLVAGVGCFLLAWRLFPRFVQDEDDQAPTRVVVRGGSKLRLLGMSRPSAGLWAVIWKDFHFTCGGRLMLIVKPVLFLAVVGGMAAWIEAMGGRATATAEHFGDIAMIVGIWWVILESGLHLSRIYAAEVRWQTLDALVGLPYDIAQIAYAKLAVVFFALLPVLGLFMLGALLSPNDFAKGISEILGHVWGWLAVVSVLYFWHWCAYLSLVLRRGSFAAAIGAMILSYFLLAMLAFMAIRGSDGEGMAVVIMIVMGIICVALHIKTAVRLRAKAGF